MSAARPPEGPVLSAVEGPVQHSRRREVSKRCRILFSFIILIICLSWIQSYCFRHNAHTPSDAASNSVPANKQTRAIRIRLPSEIPDDLDEPEGEIGAGVKGVNEASPSAGTDWVLTDDMGVFVG